MNNVHFSSKSDSWTTPHDLYEKYHELYQFELDAAASHRNSKCPLYFDDSGLEEEWCIYANKVWLNPPYSDVKSWIKKAYEQSLKQVTTVMLIPARTDTSAWHEYVFPYAKVEFLRGRLKFSHSKNSAPFPSAIVIFKGKL